MMMRFTSRSCSGEVEAAELGQPLLDQESAARRVSAPRPAAP
jgi:hypothetical protein